MSPSITDPPSPPGPASFAGPDRPDFDLKSYVTQRRDQVNRELTRWLGGADPARPIVEAMTYSLMAGGKRLRPILCIAAAESVGKADMGVIRAGCALELIHTYSLVHDDLPAIDDDDLRRGKPTCHVAFGESTAILAGDALLTLAFEVLSHAGMEDPRRAEAWLRVIHVIATAAGHEGMIEGQMRDIAAEGDRLPREAIQGIHTLKTGRLIEASVAAGALIAGAGAEDLSRLRNYGRNIGLAFQVTDDILNVEGDPELLGKSVGTDQAHQKNTYPSVMGLNPSKAYARQLVADALQALADFGIGADPLRAIGAYVVERRR